MKSEARRGYIKRWDGLNQQTLGNWEKLTSNKRTKSCPDCGLLILDSGVCQHCQPKKTKASRKQQTYTHK